MIEELLYLNKELIDIIGKSVIRKIQIGDIGDISSRKSNFSYSIKVVRTTNSAQKLDMLATNGNTSRKPFESVVADYIVNGVPLITNGFAKISSTSEFFIINLFDGVKGLSELLKGKKIIDLEFADLNHFLTAQEYIDSYSNDEGFIYCIADYGQGLPITTLKVERQAPSIYSHTIFRKIFEQVGLNLVGDFFTSNQDYLTEVITPAKGYEIVDIPFVSTAKGGADTNELADFQQSSVFIKVTEKFTFSNNGLVGASIVDGNIKFNVAGNYKLDFITSSDTSQTFAWLSFKINGITKATISLEEGNGKTKNSSLTFPVEVNDVVSLFLTATSHYVDPPAQFTIDYKVSSDTLLYLQTGGQLITVNDYIGDLTQLDFIEDIMNRFGLILHPIINSLDYRFQQIENVLNDRITFEDWTKKVSVITDENYVSGYAQSSKAIYQYPESIVIPNNDGQMIIDNKNADAEKTIISSGFEIPNKSILFAGVLTYQIYIWSLDPNVVLEETPLKVMKIIRVNTTIQAKLFDDIASVDQTGDIPYLSLENMSMQYFLDNYYLAFKNLINNYKKLTILMKLTLIDILNIDFFKLKYLKQTGRFYYLNNITHTPDKLSKVTMIEIKEFE